MKSPFDLHERAAVAAIKAGERELLRHFRPERLAKTSFKAHRELVTAADHAANRAIQHVLRKLTPDVPILSEEGTIHASPVVQTRLRWILDPLDGTTNFAIGLPLWGISLALIEDETVMCGWLSMPKLDERFFARLGEGAWRNGKPFRLKNKLPMKNGVGLFCHGYTNEDRTRGLRTSSALALTTLSTRRLGAACVELSWVATGRASYVVISGAKPWDLAAGTLLVTEAGGFLSQPNGRLWTLDEGGLVAANPASFQEILRTLKQTR